jgi:hypothetical protein
MQNIRSHRRTPDGSASSLKELQSRWAGCSRNHQGKPGVGHGRVMFQGIHCDGYILETGMLPEIMFIRKRDPSRAMYGRGQKKNLLFTQKPSEAHRL